MGIPAASLETNLPLGAINLRLDELSAFFLAVIGLVALPIAFYSIGYLKAERGPRLFAAGSLFNLLLFSLVLIVVANDLVVFLVGWEIMAFVSSILVNFHYEDRSVIRSSFLMLAISELGTIGILIAFLLLSQAAGSFSYQAIHTAAPQLPALQKSVIFLLVLFASGPKLACCHCNSGCPMRIMSRQTISRRCFRRC